MRQIPYGSSSHRLYLSYPEDWDVANVKTVTVAVSDLGGNSLLTATACTRFANNTTASALTRGADYIALQSALTGASPVEDDLFLLASSASGPREIVACSYYDAANKYIYTKDETRYAHASGVAVYGVYCFYDADFSDTDDYPKSKQLVLTWTPDAGGVPVVERAEIAAAKVGIGIESTFAVRYPREYRSILANSESFADYIAIVREELGIALANRGLMMHRVVDQERLKPVTIALCRYMVTLSGGDDWATEVALAEKEYSRQFEALCSAPIWADEDQDGIEDDDEVDDHSAWQMLNSERGI